MQNSKTTVRLDVNEANIKSVRVRDLIGQIKSNYDHEPKYKFELMFGGLCMRPDQSLGYYGVQSGATIFLMDRSQHWIEEEDRKEEDEDEEEDLPTQSQNKRQKLNTPEMDLVMTAIQLVMMDADFRAMLRRLCDTDTREQLLAKVPALAKDLVALSKLRSLYSHEKFLN